MFSFLFIVSRNTAVWNDVMEELVEEQIIVCEEHYLDEHQYTVAILNLTKRKQIIYTTAFNKMNVHTTLFLFICQAYII